MKEVIRIHKPNSNYFIEKRLVMNVHDELVYQKFQVAYSKLQYDKVTLFVAYESLLKQYKNHHTQAIVNLFNRTFISNYSIQLWLLDSGTFFFKVFGNNLPSLSGYLNKGEQTIKFTSSNDGISFYRHYMWDMLKEISGHGNIKFSWAYNWAVYECE